MFYKGRATFQTLLKHIQDSLQAEGKSMNCTLLRLPVQKWLLYYFLRHCCCCLVPKSCRTLLRPRGLELSRLLYPWDFLGEYWSGLPFPSPGNLLDPGTKFTSPVLQVDSLLLNHRKSSSQTYLSSNLTFVSWVSFASVLTSECLCFSLKSSKITGGSLNKIIYTYSLTQCQAYVKLSNIAYTFNFFKKTLWRGQRS